MFQVKSIFAERLDTQTENFFTACMEGNIDTVKELIEQKVDINTIHPEYGDTALSQAAFKNHGQVVEFLLTKEISAYSKNMALILACQAGNTEIVEQLLTSGADPNFYHQDYHTPLYQVIAQNKLTTFKKLIEAKNIDLNYQDKEGILPLLLASYNGQEEMVQLFIAKGVNILIKNKDGWTAEMMAKSKGHLLIIKTLNQQEIKNNLRFFKQADETLHEQTDQKLELEKISQLVSDYLA